MKKVLSLIMLLGVTTGPLLADIKCDLETGLFYSIPEAEEIDEVDYNLLFLQVGTMIVQLMNSGVYGKKASNQIAAYLRTLNTPTSLRLLADLQKESE